MSTKIQNYLNLHLFQKEQILGCYMNLITILKNYHAVVLFIETQGVLN